MQWDTESTIVAISTGNQTSERGSIRVAGPDVVTVLSKCDLKFDPRDASEGNSFRDRMRAALSGDISKVDFHSINSQVRIPCFMDLNEIDKPAFGLIPIDVWFWPDHRSYCGTPTAELHTIGNPVLLDQIIQRLLVSGAKLAQPGEFTLRAFLASRLDLTQCEAVLGVIEARSRQDFDVALQQLAGGLSRPLSQLRKELIELLADLEAGLDFVDEDIQFVSAAQVINRLQQSTSLLEKLQKQIRDRSTNIQGPKVAIVGLPNAGKSSLFNALIGQSKSIVTSVAGTTRDFVQGTVDLTHGRIQLIDTAGFESNDDQTPQGLSQRLAEEQSMAADLVLYCVDRNLPIELARAELATAMALMDRRAASRPALNGLHRNHPPFLRDSVWIVWTKCDSVPNPENRSLHLDCESTLRLTTSAQNRLGLEPLLALLNDWNAARDSESSNVAGMTSARCAGALQEGIEALHAAHHSAVHQEGDEIIAGELRLALEAIGTVAGEVYTDDILDALFSRFCIGK